MRFAMIPAITPARMFIRNSLRFASRCALGFRPGRFLILFYKWHMSMIACDAEYANTLAEKREDAVLMPDKLEDQR